MKTISQKEPKILFMLYNLAGGGAERVTIDLLDSSQNPQIRNASLAIYDYTGELAYSSQLKYIRELHDLKRNLLYTLQVINKYDVIIFSLELKSHLFSFIAKMLGKKVICWVHKDMRYYLYKKKITSKIIYHTISSLIYSIADYVVTVSDGCADSIRLCYKGLDHKKVVCIYNTINFNRINLMSTEPLPKWFLEWRNYELPLIVSVGRLCYQKGYDLLLSAFSMLIERNCKAQLLILGEGDDRKKLEAQADALDISQYIKLPGFFNPYNIMKESNLYVLSSRYEGLPTVLLESLYLDVPIISFNCPSGPAEILAGLKDVLVEPEQINSLADAIEKFLIRANLMHNSSNYSKNSKIQIASRGAIISKWMLLIDGCHQGQVDL